MWEETDSRCKANKIQILGHTLLLIGVILSIDSYPALSSQISEINVKVPPIDLNLPSLRYIPKFKVNTIAIALNIGR